MDTTNNTLHQNQRLLCEESIRSNNGLYQARFQDDGNFVLYYTQQGQNQFPIWASGTFWYNLWGNMVMTLQADGNLITYALANGQTIGSLDQYHNGNGTGCFPPYRMIVEDSGKLSIIDSRNVVIWQRPENNQNQSAEVIQEFQEKQKLLKNKEKK